MPSSASSCFSVYHLCLSLTWYRQHCLSPHHASARPRLGRQLEHQRHRLLCSCSSSSCRPSRRLSSQFSWSCRLRPTRVSWPRPWPSSSWLRPWPSSSEPSSPVPSHSRPRASCAAQRPEPIGRVQIRHRRQRHPTGRRGRHRPPLRRLLRRRRRRCQAHPVWACSGPIAPPPWPAPSPKNLCSPHCVPGWSLTSDRRWRGDASTARRPGRAGSPRGRDRDPSRPSGPGRAPRRRGRRSART